MLLRCITIWILVGLHSTYGERYLQDKGTIFMYFGKKSPILLELTLVEPEKKSIITFSPECAEPHSCTQLAHKTYNFTEDDPNFIENGEFETLPTECYEINVRSGWFQEPVPVCIVQKSNHTIYYPYRDGVFPLSLQPGAVNSIYGIVSNESVGKQFMMFVPGIEEGEGKFRVGYEDKENCPQMHRMSEGNMEYEVTLLGRPGLTKRVTFQLNDVMMFDSTDLSIILGREFNETSVHEAVTITKEEYHNISDFGIQLKDLTLNVPKDAMYEVKEDKVTAMFIIGQKTVIGAKVTRNYCFKFVLQHGKMFAEIGEREGALLPPPQSNDTTTAIATTPTISTYRLIISVVFLIIILKE